MTEATQQRLHDGYVVESRGLVEIKGKGQMRTFLLCGHAAVEVDIPAAV